MRTSLRSLASRKITIRLKKAKKKQKVKPKNKKTKKQSSQPSSKKKSNKTAQFLTPMDPLDPRDRSWPPIFAWKTWLGRYFGRLQLGQIQLGEKNMRFGSPGSIQDIYGTRIWGGDLDCIYHRSIMVPKMVWLSSGPQQPANQNTVQQLLFRSWDRPRTSPSHLPLLVSLGSPLVWRQGSQHPGTSRA